MRHREARDENGWLNGIDKLLEHRTRLAISVVLTRDDEVSFSRLKILLDETDGNLGANLRKLEDAGYLAVRKEFRDRRPVSWYSLTDLGRARLRSHVSALEALIDHVGRDGSGARGGGDGS